MGAVFLNEQRTHVIMDSAPASADTAYGNQRLTVKSGRHDGGAAGPQAPYKNTTPARNIGSAAKNLSTTSLEQQAARRYLDNEPRACGTSACSG
jgi:hypothetical protein